MVDCLVIHPQGRCNEASVIKNCPRFRFDRARLLERCEGDVAPAKHSVDVGTAEMRQCESRGQFRCALDCSVGGKPMMLVVAIDISERVECLSVCAVE